MSGSLNKVTLIGNLGADPEILSTQSGGRVAKFRIATSEKWTDKNSGEKKERAEWHSVVVWNDGLVGVVEKWLNKGDKVYVEGELQTRRWFRKGDEETSENARYSTEVVLTGFGGKLILLGGGSGSGGISDDKGNASRPGNDAKAYAEQSSGGARQTTAQALDDDIPF